MKGEFRLRPKAIADLDSIWHYTVEAWGEDQAERYLQMLNTSFNAIAKDPERVALVIKSAKTT